MVDRVKMRIHINKFGSQERILIEPIINKMAVNVFGVGERIVVATREEEELVSVLGGVRFVGKDFKRLFEITLFA